MAQVQCRVPKCYKTIDTQRCMAPNPWILFLRAIKGQHLTKQQKKDAYAQYKAIYVNVKLKHDEDPYRGALCLQKMHVPRAARPRYDIYVNNLRQRLAALLDQNAEHYRKECDIPEDVVRFFEQVVKVSILGTTLNVCEVVPLMVLKGCVPKEERRFYTVENYLGSGLHGFVFNCRYKNREDRVVKLMVLRSAGQPVKPIPFQDGKVQPLDIQLFRREVNAYQMMVCKAAETTKSLYRIPHLYGDSCITSHTVTDPQTGGKRNIMLGAYIMEKLPESFDEGKLFTSLRFADAHKHKLHTIIRILRQLHRRGMGHGDLHFGNIAFVGRQNKPFLLDFGRTFDLSTMSKSEAAAFKLMDYVMVLFYILRVTLEHVDSVEKEHRDHCLHRGGEMYNFLLDRINEGAASAEITYNTELLRKIHRGHFRGIFNSPMTKFTKHDIRLQEYFLRETFNDRPLFSRKRDFMQYIS